MNKILIISKLTRDRGIIYSYNIIAPYVSIKAPLIKDNHTSAIWESGKPTADIVELQTIVEKNIFYVSRTTNTISNPVGYEIRTKSNIRTWAFYSAGEGKYKTHGFDK